MDELYGLESRVLLMVRVELDAALSFLRSLHAAWLRDAADHDNNRRLAAVIVLIEEVDMQIGSAANKLRDTSVSEVCDLHHAKH